MMTNIVYLNMQGYGISLALLSAFIYFPQFFVGSGEKAHQKLVIASTSVGFY